MDTGFIKIAAIAPPICVANVQKNRVEIQNVILEMQKNSVQILVFPELSLTGASTGDLLANSTIIEACEVAIQQLLEFTRNVNMLICVGAPIRYCGKLYDCAVLMQNGQLISVIPKSYINYHKDADRVFFSGAHLHTTDFTLCGQTVPFGSCVVKLSTKATLFVQIGDDFFAPLSPALVAATAGANIIVTMSAVPAAVQKEDYIATVLKAESGKTSSAYIFSSAQHTESSTDYVYAGFSAIAENGSLLKASSTYMGEDVGVIADIDMDRLTADKIQMPCASVQHTTDSLPVLNLPKQLLSLTKETIDRTFTPYVFIPENKAEAKKRAEQILQIQSHALQKRMQHIGCNKMILGLSGGLDSTLALLVAIRTAKLLHIENKNVHCVTLPGFGTTDRTYQNALLLAKSFQCTLSEINISNATLQHFEDIHHDVNVRNAAYENAQARERTQILMDMANDEGSILIGTGDLSELALGWCTFNADHMSMYGVNADVPKTLVRYLVQYEAENVEEPIAKILLDVVDTPISPELLPPDKEGKIEQKTENTLGPYEVHDFFLYYFIRFGYSPEKLLLASTRAFKDMYTEEQLKGWLTTFIRRFFCNQFKRSCLPDGPKVGSVGISPRGEWKMPSDMDFSSFLNF